MKTNYFYLLALVLLLAGCYPQGVEYYEETDIVYTDYEDEFQFSGKNTYSIPDRIVKVTGNLEDGELPEFVEEPYNTEMLDKMKANMSLMGYEQVPDPADADLVLFPAVWTNTTIYYWYNYWCWYYPYYCGWGWGYPNVSTQTTGTLVMTLVHDGPNYVDPIRVWTGAANGLLSKAYNTSRVTKAIDQAFTQSPYLSQKSPQ